MSLNVKLREMSSLNQRRCENHVVIHNNVVLHNLICLDLSARPLLSLVRRQRTDVDMEDPSALNIENPTTTLWKKRSHGIWSHTHLRGSWERVERFVTIMSSSNNAFPSSKFGRKSSPPRKISLMKCDYLVYLRLVKNYPAIRLPRIDVNNDLLLVSRTSASSMEGRR